MESQKKLADANISGIAFWDVDVSQVDMEKESLFVMTKVFNYGSWNDMKAVLKYYGTKRIRREIVQASYLKKTALSFLCLVMDLEKKDFLSIMQREKRGGIVWDL